MEPPPGGVYGLSFAGYVQPAHQNLCRILAYVVLAVLLNFPFVF